MTNFEAALARARKERIPVMALRPDHEDSELLDDIVVQDVEMFRAEAMDKDVWWLCCYFPNGERVTFHLRARCRPTRLEFSATEYPDHWLDWEEMRGD